jgi:poly(3-hydroxybutyrate) depolymerase
MSQSRSYSLLIAWSASLLLTASACGSSGMGGGEGGSNGTGGSSSGGSVGSGGSTSSGGATGGSSSGGSPGTGGIVSGSGGSGTGGSGGAVTGTGGSGTAGAGGSGGRATGGTTGTGGSATGSGGHAGSGDGGGSGAAGAGAGGNGGSGKGGAAGSGSGGAAGGTGGAGGSAAGSAGMSAGCGKTPTIASSNYNNGHHIAITVGSMAREYILNVPTNYDNTHPYKFVIAYHELNGNDDEMYKNSYYHLLPLSNNTTIFVAPNGQQGNANCTQASGCGWPNPSDTDMKLADAVVSQIEDNFCVDTNRIFATGWSYGASMSEQTACERPLTGAGATNPWGVRAIAVYSVAYLSNTDNCKATSSKPVAYYASHGTNDTVLPYSGGVSIVQAWAAADGCTAETPTQATGNHVCSNFAGCSAGYPVEFCSFVGPHTPDPTDSGQKTSWEYQNVWTFLSQF